MQEDELEILEVFSEEDIKFNKKMVNRALNIDDTKIKSNKPDFIGEILNEFRKKWGIYD